jgi:hypothetical protein
LHDIHCGVECFHTFFHNMLWSFISILSLVGYSLYYHTF